MNQIMWIYPYLKEIEFMVKNFPTKKTPGPDSFPGEFWTVFKEEILTILYKVFQKIEEDRILSKSLYESGIVLVLNETKIL